MITIKVSDIFDIIDIYDKNINEVEIIDNYGHVVQIDSEILKRNEDVFKSLFNSTKSDITPMLISKA